jgi:hypothetical protein
LNNALRALEIAASHHAADPTFPRWYPALFGRRWRFATSRLALYESPENLTLILAMGARSPIDRNIVSWIWQTTRGRLRRLVMLAWLWIRLRPYWLPDLLKTHLARSLASKCPKRSSQRTSRSPREHQP